MKCLQCIRYLYFGNDRPMIHEAISKAKDAVTVDGGEALCEDHLKAPWLKQVKK